MVFYSISLLKRINFFNLKCEFNFYNQFLCSFLKTIMTTFSIRLLILMEILIQISEASIVSYDASFDKTCLIQSDQFLDFDEENFNYFILCDNKSQYRFIALNLIQRSSTIYKGNSTYDLAIVSTSTDATCSLISRSISGTIADYFVVTVENQRIKYIDLQILPPTQQPEFSLHSNFQLGTLCRAFRFGANVYRLKSETYSPDPIPSTFWINPIFNKDFTIAVANNGIYTFIESIWTLTTWQLFFINKKIWNLGTKIVILTWNETFHTKLYIYNGNNQEQTHIAQISVQLNSIPLYSISSSLNKIIVYGRLAAEGNDIVYLGKSIDYDSHLAQDLQFPSFILSKQNILTVSNSYLYARVKQGSNHSGYYFNGANIVEIFSNQIVPIQILSYYKRSVFYPSNNNSFLIYHEIISPNFQISIQRTFKDQITPVAQIVSRKVSQSNSDNSNNKDTQSQLGKDPEKDKIIYINLAIFVPVSIIFILIIIVMLVKFKIIRPLIYLVKHSGAKEKRLGASKSYQIQNTSQSKVEIIDQTKDPKEKIISIQDLTYLPESTQDNTYTSSVQYVTADKQRRKRQNVYSEQLRKKNKSKLSKSKHFHKKYQETIQQEGQIQNVEQKKNEGSKVQVVISSLKKLIPKQKRYYNKDKQKFDSNAGVKNRKNKQAI